MSFFQWLTSMYERDDMNKREIEVAHSAWNACRLDTLERAAKRLDSLGHRDAAIFVRRMKEN